VSEVCVARWALYRLHPGQAAQARGYLAVMLGRAGAREWLLPVGGGLDFYLRAGDEAVTVLLGGEATLERAGWAEAALALVRRYLTRLRRGVLDFDGVEVFPRGGKKQTKLYGKHVRYARRTRTAPDGRVMREHPELILGWPEAEPDGPTACVAAAPRIAVALHLYYTELWPEIETLLRRWRVPFTLFLTLTREDAELTRRVLSIFPGSAIRIVENCGRDVRPFLVLLEEGAFDKFEFVCKIHGKRSIGLGRFPVFGDIVRRAMFLALIASDQQVQEIIQMFEVDGRIGVIGPARFRVVADDAVPRDLLGRNRRAAEAIAARMGGTALGNGVDYFEGTMFWVRPQALAPLARLCLAETAFAPEAGLADGALEHAIERLFNHTARLAGFGVDEVLVF